MDCNCKIMEMQLEDIKKQLAKEKENCKKTAKQLEEVKTKLDKEDKKKRARAAYTASHERSPSEVCGLEKALDEVHKEFRSLKQKVKKLHDSAKSMHRIYTRDEESEEAGGKRDKTKRKLKEKKGDSQIKS